MARMSSSSKGKSSGGLRILWIPGRKKHNRKGVYNPTKSGIPQYQANQQRKTEPWSLGGTMNHTKIINADLHDNLDVGMATASGAMSLAAMASNSKTIVATMPEGECSGASSSTVDPATVTAETASCSGERIELVVLNDLNGDINKRDIPTGNQFDQLELIDECDEKDRNYSNAESSSSLLSSKDNDSHRQMDDYMHNSATLAIGEARRRRRRNSYNNSKKNSCENLDSIDHLNDQNESDVDDAGDSVDAVKINGARTANEPRLDTFRAQQKKGKNKKKDKKKNVPDEEQRNKDDKLVTCLYYSLVCWDCSIS
ncbi:hypothetical protein pipiens_003035 [Culex pipiens pipiens]|uniref:Uncharacterized protein n=1 Tax=Culex pipiens pipiens TaxID=38569 RepID=A0ABD1D4J9_CULPP